VPFIITQQQQPAFMQAVMQSQQLWIMSQHALSPLVQVRVQPSLVISTLQTPIVRQQLQTVIPFIMQQQEHIPPAIMVNRFCIIPQAAWSVVRQVIFIPLATFSIVMVQRGTIIIVGAAGIPIPAVGLIPGDIPGIIMPARSIIIAVVMISSS
jgi:hypothetical protein